MLTWTLWRELRNPPRSHPLFWRVVQQGQQAGNQWWIRLIQIVGILGFVALAIVSLPTALVMLVCGIIGVPIFMLIGSSGFYAALSAMDTADALAQEERSGTHDLLRVTPAGAPAVDWLVASACLARNHRLGQTHALVRAVTIAGGLAIGAVTLFLVASVANAQQEGRFAVPLIALNDMSRILALILIIYLDHIHSFISGGLVGIITAYAVGSPLEARVWAFFGFWTQQITVYALVFGLTLLTWNFIEQAFEPTAGRALLMSGISLFFYAVVREALLAGLWRWMLSLSFGSTRSRAVTLR